MIKIKKLEKCCGCEACVNICPMNCIQLEEKELFFYPKVDILKCINCNKCEAVCPMKGFNYNNAFAKKGYICVNSNSEERIKSTSGGVGFLFAKDYIEKGGVVFGVTFDDHFNTKTSECRSLEDIKKTQGSKYSQSENCFSFKKIKNLLESNNNVLFFGTPCQVAGLLSFLGKEYSNLITIDLICYGVASPIVWQHYLKMVFGEISPKIVEFKNKENGWKNWQVLIKSDRQLIKESGMNNSFMSTYLNGFNIRPSCFECPFKGFDGHLSDITIGDAWGIPESDKDFDNFMGLSCAVVNGEKGASFFQSVSNNMQYKEIPLNKLLYGNPAYFKCHDKNVFRKKFVRDSKSNSNYLLRYSNNSIFVRIDRFIKKFFKEKE